MQKRQYSRSRERPLGARWLPAFLQPCHSHKLVSARTGACFGPRGAMRILSNSFESKLMNGYDACGGYASSLDIAQTAMTRRILFRNAFTISSQGPVPRANGYLLSVDEPACTAQNPTHAREGRHHKEAAGCLRAGERRGDRRIRPASWPCRPPARRPDPLQGLYRIEGVRWQEPA